MSTFLGCKNEGYWVFNSYRQPWGPLINFTNILCAVFTQADPKSAKTLWLHHRVFALLGSTLVKAVRKHFGEIDPWSAPQVKWLEGISNLENVWKVAAYIYDLTFNVRVVRYVRSFIQWIVNEFSDGIEMSVICPKLIDEFFLIKLFAF